MFFLQFLRALFPLCSREEPPSGVSGPAPVAGRAGIVQDDSEGQGAEERVAAANDMVKDEMRPPLKQVDLEASTFTCACVCIDRQTFGSAGTDRRWSVRTGDDR